MNNKIVLEILKNRGMDNKEEIEEFLSPKPKKTYDPFLLLNMKESVDKILKACHNDEKICIYGDYDADGVTSVSILIHVISQLTNNLIYFVPSRFKDGYGLSKSAIENLKQQNVDLIVTVDCGITAINEVDYCKSLGIDIIITDHHTTLNTLPDCLIINPKQKACTYPFKDLAGCGVAFKLAQGIVNASGLPKSVLNHTLDIVAIGTIGDIVPLIDENRTIVKYGLKSIYSKKKNGLKALSDLLNIENIDSQTVSFSIVPHLNAGGRIRSAETGIKLFSSENDKDANLFAKELIKLNIERQNIQRVLFDKAKAIYEADYKNYLFPLIILDNAHEGVTGIVAGKMKDYCKKPIALLTKDHSGQFLKGTSRAIGNINIYEILSKANDKGLFENFGGHKGACGFTIKEENYKELVKVIESEISKIPQNEFIDPVTYDLVLDVKDITIKLANDLEVFEPTGHINPKPIFKIENIKVRNINYMGKNNEHIKITCFKDKVTFTALCFSYKNIINSTINIDDTINIYGTLNVNTWNNKSTPQIIISFIDLIKTI